MPKPESGLSSALVAADTPIPIASTSGTVTGPVVIAPQSHASPIIGSRRLSMEKNRVMLSPGTRVAIMSDFRLQP